MTFDPTDEQRTAVDHPLTPLRLVAGAGTGKTTVMAQRILARRAGRRAPPTTRCSASRSPTRPRSTSRRRCERRSSRNADVTIATYHSFGASLVAGHAPRARARPRRLRCSTGHSRGSCCSRCSTSSASSAAPRWPPSSSSTTRWRSPRAAPTTSCRSTTVIADCARDHGRTVVGKMKEQAEARLELCQVVEAYERRKRERNLIDFGDQVGLAVKLLDERPDLAAGLRARAPGGAARRVPGHQLRPAPDAAAHLPAGLGHHRGRRRHAVDLRVPRRAPAQHPAVRAALRAGRHAPAAGDVPLRCRARANWPTASRARCPSSLPKVLRAAGRRRSRPRSSASSRPTTPTKPTTIAAEIAARGGPWRDTAILCRKRRLTNAIVAALDEHDVPVDVVGASGLLDRPEVVDLVAWLELLADPSASVALLRILEGPRYRIGRRDLGALARHVHAMREAAGGDDRADDRALADALTELDAIERSLRRGARRDWPRSRRSAPRWRPPRSASPCSTWPRRSSSAPACGRPPAGGATRTCCASSTSPARFAPGRGRPRAARLPRVPPAPRRVRGGHRRVPRVR